MTIGPNPALALGKSIGYMVSTGVAAGGAWVVAQAGALGDWPELIGGGIVLTAGLLSLRMVLRSATHERESAKAIEERLKAEVARLEGRAEELELELDAERQRAARLLLAFDRERNLRVSLERAGIPERRRQDDTDPDALEQSIDIGETPSIEDVTALTTELEEQINGELEES